MEAMIILFRGSGIGFVILLLAWIIQNHKYTSAGRFLALTLIGILGYLIAPVVEPGWLLHISVFFASLIPPFFWIFTRALVNDSPVPTLSNKVLIPTLLIYQVLVFSSYINTSVTQFLSASATEWLYYASAVLKLGFLAHALLSVITQWRNDLVESRRTFRLLLMIVSSTYIVAIVLVELYLQGHVGSPELEAINALFISLIIGCFTIWCLLINPSGLLGDITTHYRMLNQKESVTNCLASQTQTPTIQSIPFASSAIGTNEKEKLTLPRADQIDIDTLSRVMEVEQAYIQSDLTIGRLAERVGIPEHRLRKLVNQYLGYRNYNDYVNKFRIEEAARRLKEPDYARIPILTIAFEVGFSSIAPFNRSFRARYGTPPSIYRNQPQPPSKKMSIVSEKS